ncbi:methyltransferase domain-containing protein [Brucella pseudogrignonensis]|uniref:methyltransferase domain-containing protein n=1 Tax=Brucella pseudogrignonensis TaxID=419475 RepID=UPI003D99236A
MQWEGVVLLNVTCNLCGSVEVKHCTAFVDKSGASVNLGVCIICEAIQPEYSIIDPRRALRQQTSFHESWWKDSTEEVLDEELANLKDLVSVLKAYLGPPAEDNVVLEIGAGRGGLLKALLDSGYNAKGCEPATELVELARKFYSLAPDVLFDLTANDFIEDIVSELPVKPNSFILWHVLEHVENPLSLLEKLARLLKDDGCILLQLPLLKIDYVYPEHYYFVSHRTSKFIANSIGLVLDDIEYDVDNLFATICLRKTSSVTDEEFRFLGLAELPTPLAQGILLREASLSSQKDLLEERMDAIRSMEQMIIERDGSLSSQGDLLEERMEAIRSMEQMIIERDESLSSQKDLLEERMDAIRSMEQMIIERDGSLSSQGDLLEERMEAIRSMEQMIIERDESLSSQRNLLEERAKSLESMERMIADQKHKSAEQNATIENLEIKLKQVELQCEHQKLHIQDIEQKSADREAVVKSLEVLVTDHAKIVADLEGVISEIEAKPLYKLLHRIGLF